MSSAAGPRASGKHVLGCGKSGVPDPDHGPRMIVGVVMDRDAEAVVLLYHGLGHLMER